jgi:NTP pyrophosphatase (non-canonical NTP hydrolase)
MSFDKMVMELQKSGADIIADLTPEKAQLLHMGMLLMEEAGEVGGIIKKMVFYDKEKIINLIDELGDIEFALSAIRQMTGLDRDSILRANQHKLSKRYPKNVFSLYDALNRADTKD